MKHKKLSEENKDKVCNICKLVINQDKEFCEFIHYRKEGDKLSTAYYHVNCFQERLRGAKELSGIQARLNNLMVLAEQRLV